jgi:hypothetical protein
MLSEKIAIYAVSETSNSANSFHLQYPVAVQPAVTMLRVLI